MAQKEQKNQPQRKLPLAMLIVLILAYIIYLISQTKKPEAEELSYSSFIKKVRRGVIEQVTIKGEDIYGITRSKKLIHTVIPYNDPYLLRTLINNRVKVYGVKQREGGGFLAGLLNFIWLFLPIFIIWFLLFRQVQGPPGKVFSFGRSRATMQPPKTTKVTFKDVAGVDEAKEELQEVIEFLKDPKKFTRLGARIPKGVLLVGPPGTGKTLLAKAVAGEANVPFFSISGSEFVEMFVGVGAARVRDLFERAKKNAPCIVFVDELDAVGRYRGAGIGGGHDEREQTLNQLLVEMDGFNPTQGIIIIAATNRPDVLDPALLRPGRFDRQIVVDIPDIRGREEILKVHTRKVPLAPDVDLKVIARATPGFTGADLENLVNEAALLAARRNKRHVTMQEFEEAKDKVLMGPERKSIIISEKDKQLTAYHEAGHALLTNLLPNADPLHKVTIIPRGRALGVTQSLPVDERKHYTKEYWLDHISVLLGGRAAEEIKFNTVTTGAMDDIEKATKIARKMVCDWGMSEKLGPLSVSAEKEHIFLGKEIAEKRNFSEKLAEEIDEEIRNLISREYKRTKTLLKQNWKLLEKIAEKLLEKEVLTGDEIKEIISQNKKKKKKGGRGKTSRHLSPPRHT